MALIDCSECGQKVSDKAASCPHCGNPILPKMAGNHCSECGEAVSDKAAACPECGNPTLPNRASTLASVTDAPAGEAFKFKESRSARNKKTSHTPLILAVLVLGGWLVYQNIGQRGLGASATARLRSSPTNTVAGIRKLYLSRCYYHTNKVYDVDEVTTEYCACTADRMTAEAMRDFTRGKEGPRDLFIKASYQFEHASSQCNYVTARYGELHPEWMRRMKLKAMEEFLP